MEITSASGRILHRGVQPEEKIIELLNVSLEILNDISLLLNNKIMQLTKYRQKLYALIEGDELTKAIYEALLQSSVFFGSGISIEGLKRVTGKSRNTIKSRLDSMPPKHISAFLSNNNKKVYKLNLSIV